MKKNNHFLLSLDGIRAVSIFLVLGSHISQSANFNKFNFRYLLFVFNGELGVNIFFVLSGFLITYLLIKEKNETEEINLFNFYLRRFLRIFPVYYLFIIVLSILDYSTNVNFTVCEYLSSIFFVKNFGCGQWIDGHLWSIAVEEQFYLIWPFVLRFLSRKYQVVFAIILIIAAPFFRTYFYINNLIELRLFSFFSNMDCLMIGSLFGMYYYNEYKFIEYMLNYKPHIIRLLAFIMISAILFLQANLTLGWITVPFGKTIQSLAIIYLIISYVTVKKGFVFKLLNLKPMVFIGVLSYSLYIWQQLILTSSSTYFTPNNSLLFYIPFNIGFIFLLALISYYFFEKPFLNLRYKFKRTSVKTVHVVNSDSAAQTII